MAIVSSYYGSFLSTTGYNLAFMVVRYLISKLIYYLKHSTVVTISVYNVYLCRLNLVKESQIFTNFYWQKIASVVCNEPTIVVEDAKKNHSRF